MSQEINQDKAQLKSSPLKCKSMGTITTIHNAVYVKNTK